MTYEREFSFKTFSTSCIHRKLTSNQCKLNHYKICNKFDCPRKKEFYKLKKKERDEV